ncbi:MAG: NADH-quinone oxidoreductase subunit J [Actinomycetota bacterium]
MSGAEVAFSVAGVLGVAAAIRLVTARNVVHAALYLVLALVAVAVVYLLLGAEFAAWVQVLIYVGAIVILFLFGLMLTKAPIGREVLDNQSRGVAFLVALGVFAGLAVLLVGAFGGDATIGPVDAVPGIDAVGSTLFRDFVLPFEAISFLLLAALVGAVVLSRKDDRP